MLLFLENILIVLFSSLFLFITTGSFIAIPYFIIFFSIGLWGEMMHNNVKPFIFIVFVIFTAVFDKNLAFFTPVFMAVTWENKESDEKHIFIIFKFFILFCLFFNFNLIFFLFSIIIFFYSVVKNDYILKSMEVTRLKDKLTENRINSEKRERILQNDVLKNAEVLILAERNRISGSLHNSIGHTLSASILQVNALKYISNQEEVKESLNVLQTSLENGMTEIRECLHNMHNDSFNLQTGLEEIAEKTKTPKIKLTYKADVIPYELKYDILSIVKESLSNTIKHSGATELNINILEHIGFYSLIIKDNGCGSQGKQIKDLNHGIGLKVIADLVEKHKGKINFYSDNGFKTHIIFPKIKDAQNENNNS
ncbi:two-component sensor histidine kinase [Treponema sp. OMZ 789]|nr:MULTISPECIES: histidine kinase [unclassified Treponema]UTC66872.1 two-component sensor histidine kinase [Treponema sp. OMZ 789]UTC69601.1 two-component sensor histidine kinase [Treponema sp. OMZ 790]UTC72315.1 two-component sensor histidine kinase [Treponema sp. OMZ 791]